jgi:hypothetical protein
MRRAKPTFLYIRKRRVVAGHAASYQIDRCPEECLSCFIRWRNWASLVDVAASGLWTAEMDVRYGK